MLLAISCNIANIFEREVYKKCIKVEKNSPKADPNAVVLSDNKRQMEG
jgi:hypothetical protein